MKQKRKEKEELLQKMAGEVADMIQRHESKLNENDVKLKAKEVEIEKIESKKDEEIHNLISENNAILQKAKESYESQLNEALKKINKEKEEEISKIVSR